MQVQPTGFTVAEYCQQMASGQIVVNYSYQRSAKVWPAAARSYLIDTILTGYPIPKFSLYQKTDLKARRTIKEIVDGQQRSQAISDFFAGKLRLTSTSGYAGRVYSQLDEIDQNSFLNYHITCDLFVSATDQDIREVFRRINSYHVPLNAQEKRHATYQGEMKWFIVDLCNRYSQNLKDMGVFTEQQLGRMYDGALFSDIIFTLLEGIKSASDPAIDRFYRVKEENFPERKELNGMIDKAMGYMLQWRELHNGPLMKSYNFYSLAIAIIYKLKPRPVLQEFDFIDLPGAISKTAALTRLSEMADSLIQPGEYRQYREFIEACSKATNRRPQRQVRFRYFLRALYVKDAQ